MFLEHYEHISFVVQRNIFLEFKMSEKYIRTTVIWIEQVQSGLAGAMECDGFLIYISTQPH